MLTHRAGGTNWDLALILSDMQTEAAMDETSARQAVLTAGTALTIAATYVLDSEVPSQTVADARQDCCWPRYTCTFDLRQGASAPLHASAVQFLLLALSALPAFLWLSIQRGLRAGILGR